MTVRLLAGAADGAAYFYHQMPATGEHFFIGRVRRNEQATFLYCHLCDAVSTIPRAATNADHRALEALVAAGEVVVVALAEDVRPDALSWGREDVPIKASRARPLIPAVVPQRAEDRVALIATLRTAHLGARPPGSRFQRRPEPRVVEIVQDDGEGNLTVVETHDVDDDGRLTKR